MMFTSPLVTLELYPDGRFVWTTSGNTSFFFRSTCISQFLESSSRLVLLVIVVVFFFSPSLTNLINYGPLNYWPLVGCLFRVLSFSRMSAISQSTWSWHQGYLPWDSAVGHAERIWESLDVEVHTSRVPAM